MIREWLIVSVALVVAGVIVAGCRQREDKPKGQPPRTAWEAMAATAEPADYCAYMAAMMKDPNLPVRERQRRWQQCQKARAMYWCKGKRR